MQALIQLQEKHKLKGFKFALAFGTTMYPKSIRDAPDVPVGSGLLVLKSMDANRKMGAGTNIISKGKYRGLPAYQLTLIERETCPTSCLQWNTCYGNNCPFNIRHRPGEKLERALEKDVEVLAKKHPEGFLVRPHILGDYYSVEYVKVWEKLLDAYPNFYMYGTTHRRHGTDIGDAVAAMAHKHAKKCAILRSDKHRSDDPLKGAFSVFKGERPNPDVQVCLHQQGKAESCLSCGFCFTGKNDVQFLEH